VVEAGSSGGGTQRPYSQRDQLISSASRRFLRFITSDPLLVVERLLLIVNPLIIIG
jgi:hypothetical protein